MSLLPFLAIGLGVVYNSNSTASARSFIKEHSTGDKGHLLYPEEKPPCQRRACCHWLLLYLLFRPDN